MPPDFLIIGAQRSGTTWLYDNLMQHPQIWMSPTIKEYQYFDEVEERGTVRLWELVFGNHWRDKFWRNRLKRSVILLREYFNWEDLIWTLRFFFGKRSDSWYLSLFDGKQDLVTGEISPTYATLNKNSVEHVYRLLPDVKIIMMLRDPIQRSWSHVMYDINKRGPITFSSAQEGHILSQINSDWMEIRSRYTQTLELWHSFYPAEQIYVGFFEDLVNKPKTLLKEIFTYLGVSASDVILDRVILEKREAGPGNTLPEKYHKILAEMWIEELRLLSEKYGGYTITWYESALGILDQYRNEKSS
jgi:hypothetical protein